jgi:hypothetical protein
MTSQQDASVLQVALASALALVIIATTGMERLSRLPDKQNQHQQLASLDGHGERAGAPRLRIKLDAPQVVIAMAAYDAEAAFWDNAFIWSLRCTGYKGDIVLMVTPKIHQRECSEKLKQWFIDMKVVTVPYELMSPGCPTKDDLDKVDFVEPRCFGIFEPEVTRYLYNGKILDEMYPDPETRVFLPDYRDVIYQVGSCRGLQYVATTVADGAVELCLCRLTRSPCRSWRTS